MHFRSSTAVLQFLLNSLILLCCGFRVLVLHKICDSAIQGNNEPIRKVKHARPCIWTSTLKKVEKVWGLIFLFQTGEIEIRYVLDLELVKESSLMSILRWNCKVNMDRTMSSNDAHITLANGYETVFMSLLAAANDFRFKIPKKFIVWKKPFPVTTTGKIRRDQVRGEAMLHLQYLISHL